MCRNTAGSGAWRTIGMWTGWLGCLTTTPSWSLPTQTSSPLGYLLIQTTSQTNAWLGNIDLHIDCTGTSSRRERRSSLEPRDLILSGRSSWGLPTTRPDLTRPALWDWWTRMSTRLAFPFTRAATTETVLRGRRATGGWVRTSDVSDIVKLKVGFFFQLLYLQWAKWTNFYKRQPLWLIKRYFGDKVSLVLSLSPLWQIS